MSRHPDWIVPQWPVPKSVRALITTRAGGVSAAPFDGGAGGGLNLGFGSGDDAAAVAGNRERLRSALPSEPAWLKQVHGRQIVDAADVAAGGLAEADGSITDRPDVVAVVMMADCLPVLLADVQGRCVGIAHAGWRGMAAGVVQATVQAMRERMQDPDARLIAYLGPAIGPDHFEVGAEVLESMSSIEGAAADFVPHGPGKYRADLFALARRALRQVGVESDFGGGLCTACDAARFYSHRRDRVTGRHAALIWLHPD